MMRYWLVRLGVVLLSCVGTVPGALAEASGPDFFRVSGVEAGSYLRLRAAPGLQAAIIGTLPADADGLRNLGCRGGLSFADFQQANETEREAGRKTRWCRVRHRGREGWAAAWYLREGTAPAPAPSSTAVSTSFPCDKASGTVERRICASPHLASLDRELARLYALAIATPNMGAARRDRLKAIQRGWIKGRNACWKAGQGEALDRCIVGEYALRLHQLRTRFAASRRADDLGITQGPFAYRCPGMKNLMSLVLVDSAPAIASLAIGGRSISERSGDGQTEGEGEAERWIALDQAPSGSGARYRGHDLDGREMEFWIIGDRARLTQGAADAQSCTLLDGG